MANITCTRSIGFDAGHRLLKHEGKCRNVHGHRYTVEIECAAEELDGVGRVIDFSAIKELVGGWIDDALDHGFIAQAGDPIISFLDKDSKVHIVNFSPTSENLARYIGENSVRLLPGEIKVVSVKLWETPNCFSTWTNGVTS